MRMTFDPNPGTVGVIKDREMIVTGELSSIRSTLTVTDLGAKNDVARLTKSIAATKLRIRRMEDAGGGGQVLNRARWSLKGLEEALMVAQASVVREYFDETDGGLSVSPGFWHLVEGVSGQAPRIPYVELPEVDGKKPRQYQVEAARALLEHDHATTSLATGLGKTVLSAQLTYCAHKAGLRTLIIVPNTTLMYQNYETIKRYIDDVSMVGDGRKMKPGSSVVVSTIQSSEKHADLFDVVQVDECHHTGADSYIKLKILATKARYWYGLTATPYRADGLDRGIEMVCGPVVYEKTTRWGIDEGFLCPVKVVFVRVKGLPWVKPDVPLAKAYYSLASSEKIKTVTERLVNAALAEGKQAGLVLYRTVEPGREYTDQYDHAFAHGEYKKQFMEFKKGMHPVLVSNAPLMGEGVDVPNIDFVVSVVNPSSESLVRQILGRGLRPSASKKALVFFDVVFGDNPTFANAAKNRLAIYRSVTDDVIELDL